VVIGQEHERRLLSTVDNRVGHANAVPSPLDFATRANGFRA
jgi:hypothetical protein